MRRRKGFAVPAVVCALALFAMYAGMVMYYSKGELSLLNKTIKQERALMIAESAVEMGRALLFQNDFENRWYKQEEFGSERIGFKGRLEGKIGGGSFLLVAEDVANDGRDIPPAKRIMELTYNRIDLFAEGRYGDTKVIVSRSLFWHPEQKCYGYTEESTTRSDGTTGPVLTDIHVR